jgi:hypothetical protein
MAVRTYSRLVVAVAVVALTQPVAAQGGGGGGGGQQQPPQNLQYFPKDMTRQQLLPIMRGFTMALGVRCEYCHVEREGATTPPGGNPALNHASDDKETKRQARYMLRMVDSINTKLLAALPVRDNPPTNVSCVTCHRGVSKPTTIEAVMTTTLNEAGVDSAISRYRTLRGDMASGRYNFSEQPVIELARTLGTQQKFADGIKLLEMLQEFYPNQVGIDFEIATLQERAGNRDAAIARYRAILTKNPNDNRARQQLTRLGVTP